MQPIKAVIFDLDGVIVSTDDYHFLAWKTLADNHGIPFDRDDNERLRGVGRMESLEIILERSSTGYSKEDKEKMAEVKNVIYRESLRNLSPSDILPGVADILKALGNRGVSVGIGSSSRNAAIILSAIGLADAFITVVDGTQISRSKPDPEVFILAATRLGVDSGQCLVVEDAEAGVEAALAAGMRVLAVGPACGHPEASFGTADLTALSVEEMLMIGEPVPQFRESSGKTIQSL